MLHECARGFIGSPFRHQGRGPRWMDCVGHLCLSAAACGWADLLAHDLVGYGKNPTGGTLDAQLRAAFGPPVASSIKGRIIDLALLRPSDVVSMYYDDAIRHVGIVGDHPNGVSLIHTSRSTRRVTEHVIDEAWATRIANVYRRAAA